MSQKRKKVLLVSPKGAAVWPHLTTPDTKFDKENGGVFRTKVAVDLNDPVEGPRAKGLIAKIDAAIEEALATQKAQDKENGKKRQYKYADKPYSMETDDNGEETGRVVFSFKQKAQGKTREGEVFKRRVALFDGQGRPLAQDTKVGGGSIISVSFELSGFYVPALGAGCSLRMEAVKISKLVEWQGRDAKGYGFDNDEDGEYEDEETSTSTSTSTDAEDSESEGGEDNGDF